MTLHPPRAVRRVIGLFTRSARDRDMDAEMAFHLESIARDYVHSGMSADEAERAARRRFGSIVRFKEEGHDVRIGQLVEDFARDAKHVARGLRRSPGFAVAVILTLAIGIGGNTAIFSVVDQLLLRPLPYPHGERLQTVYERFSPTTQRNSVSDISTRASSIVLPSLRRPSTQMNRREVSRKRSWRSSR